MYVIYKNLIQFYVNWSFILNVYIIIISLLILFFYFNNYYNFNISPIHLLYYNWMLPPLRHANISWSHENINKIWFIAFGW